jgi:predicted GNAT family acetyltransferase
VKIKAYKTPGEFLEDTQELLEEREVENNLILGVCNNLADKTKEYREYVFINSVDDSGIQATSIKTIHNAVVSGVTNDKSHVKNLADYYLDNNIDLPGAVGESFYSTEFSKFYGKRQVDELSLIVHKLTSVNSFPLANGSLELADADDVELIARWTMNFETDAKIFPVKSKEQALEETRRKITSGCLFKWTDKRQIVSIAAIMRKTRQLGIVGLVYTPTESRGKGYATSCVQKLSEYILQNDFKYCGLFTDKFNSISNHIYKKIGYLPVTEFTAIKYE